MVERIAVALETVALGLWAGALAGFAFIFAPIAFRTSGNMTTFAAFVGAALRTLAGFGAACGVAALVLALVRARITSRRFPFVRAGLVCAALAASAYEQRAIVPQMEATAAQIPGPIDSVPRDDPRRAAYDRSHDVSTRVYGFAFLCVVAATALVAFGRERPPRSLS